MHERITLGQYIAKRRQEKGLSLRTAAGRCGMSHTYLASIENGDNSNPTVDMLRGIANGLAVPYETLDRIARGLPPDDATIATETAELMALWDQVPEDRREAALRMLRGLAE